MRHAFTLLGVMSCIILFGIYLAFRDHVKEPERIELPANRAQTMSLTLTSPAFTSGGEIPQKYTCDGSNSNPEFLIEGIPLGTKSLVLLMDDPDIPESVKETRNIEKFDHWVLYNIPPDTTHIPAGESVGTVGLSSVGGMGYVGPCPPDTAHRYFFNLYALNEELSLDYIPALDDIKREINGKVLEHAVLIGTYARI